MTLEDIKNVSRENILRIVIGITMLILLTTGSALGASFKLPVTVSATGFERADKPIEISVNFTQLLNSIGQSGTIDENSIYIAETNNLWSVIDTSIPFQFDKDSGYDPTTKASGTVVFIMKGITPSSGNRYYYIYFNTGGSSTPISITPQVTLTDNIIDEGMSSYKINNINGTFYFQKAAGGFSSWTDISSNDWIGWSSNNGSSGKYRGIPNAIYAREIFHPGFVCCTTSIVSQGPIKIRIRSVNGTDWESIWDFYPRYATMTMTKVNRSDRNGSYWFLYEGTPGGTFEQNKDFIYRSDGVKIYLNQSWYNDIVTNEWAYLSDPTVRRSLFAVHHEDDTLKDIYRPCCAPPELQNNMTVFGFGRTESPVTSWITSVPQHFTIGLIDGTDFTQNSKIINSAYKNLVITKGVVEQNDGNVLLMTSYSPVNNPSTTVGTAQTFSIGLNKNANIIWKIDGAVVRTETTVAASSYTNSTAGIGTHVVNVTATNGTDIRSKEWIWTVNTNAVSEIRLTYNNSLDRQSSWSPDSQWIAFQSRGSAGWEIKKIKISDMSLMTLHDGAGGIEPAWSPSGTKIAFSRGTNDSTMDVYVMNSDGYNVQKLTNTPEYDEYPDWNPDGSKIAYVSQRSVFGGPKYIAVMNADGSNPVYYTNALGIQPTWSPDGKKIAFKCYLGGNNICSINANGTGLKQLTFNSGNTHEPDWSPDSSKIAYASNKDGDWEIYVMNADGNNQTKLTSNTVIEDNYPAWSPDIQWMAFSSNRTGNEEIWLMSVSGPVSPIFSITLYSPANNPSTIIGTAQIFSIGLNKNANIIWKIDGAVVKTETGVATSSYTNSTASIGTHIINVTATNGTDIRSKEWSWTVQNNVASITIVSPNGGENWINGTTKTINWNYIGNPGSFVQIELLKGEILDSIINSSVSIGNSGTGSYSWSIPSTQTLGNDYKVRITSITESIYNDTSNNNFTVSTITTTNINLGIPNGGENWIKGSTHDITWTGTGIYPHPKIELYKSSALQRQIAYSSPTIGTYSWTIPTDLTIGTDYKVKITACIGTDTGCSSPTTLVSDMSDANFQISGIGITITSPNGGEGWTKGSTHNITWTSSEVTSTINIFLYKGNSSILVIGSNLANSGTFSWTVPNTLANGTDYRIKIDTTTLPYVEDISNNYFTITDVVIGTRVTSPNGGENWIKGSTHDITWTGTGIYPHPKIELYKSSALQRQIAYSSPTIGTYSWTIPTDLTIGTDYKVKITACIGTDTGCSSPTTLVSDMSDANFQISESITCNAPVSNYTYAIDTTNTKNVTFTDTSTNAPTSWAWNFGESTSSNNTSTIQNPIHTYAADGTYTVTLVATNSCGTGTAASQNITTA